MFFYSQSLLIFLTQSISTFVASLIFDLNFSCNWLCHMSKSFSLFGFCLALFLAKVIVDALIKQAFVVEVAVLVNEL